MKLQRTVCLKLWLPLLVMVLFTLQLGFMMLFQSRTSVQELEQRSLQSVRQIVEHLEEEHLLTVEQFDEAEHELAILDKEQAMQAMAVVDPRGNVLLATNAEWVGKSATVIDRYFIPDHFRHALTRQHTDITLTEDGSAITVFAPIMHAEKLRLTESLQPGAFFLLYDLSGAKNSIWQTVVTDGLVLWLASLLAMSVLVAVLHVLVNRPVQHLAETVYRMANGEEGVQVRLAGGGELAELGKAFNDMSSKIRDVLASLRRSEEKNRLLLQSAGEGIIAMDREGLATIVNPAAAAMLGFTVDELIGQPVHRLVHHSHPDGSPYPATECRMLRATRKGTTEYITDEVLWRKDGSSIPVEYTSTPIQKDGAIQGLVVIFKDITRRKEAEEALRLAATAFETQEAITITDSKANIVRINRAFSEITGYSPEEVIGKTPAILKSGRHDDDFYRSMWEVLLRNGHWQGEIWNRRKNGEVYPDHSLCGLILRCLRAQAGGSGARIPCLL
jgi:PAS domain S-box-containing protein